MDPTQNLTESERFQKVLESISEFFAMDDPRSSFNRVLHDLMECCPGGVIVGGMAVSFYVKNPRTTKDVDIILLGEKPATKAFLERFEPIADKPLSVRHKDTGIEVDVLSPRNPVMNRELLEAASERFRVIERAGTEVRVAEPEMIVALKLRRAMNTTPKGLIDRADILNILTDNPEVDVTPLKSLLPEEESDLLDDLLIYREKLLTGELHD